jgi:Fe-Mn family superoxide dismutase
MEGAQWRDPELIDEWMGELSKTDPVVCYCVYGFATGCQTAKALRKAGFDARYMSSGHYGWKALGGKVRILEG